MTVRNIAAGNRDSYIGFFNDAGFFIGGSTTAPAQGASSGMLELLGVQEVPLTVPDPTLVPIPGDDDVLGTFDFDSDAARQYIITTAVNDLALTALLLGTNVESIAGGDWGVLDVLSATEVNACLIHQSRAKKYDSSNKGQKAWAGDVIMTATVKPLGRQTFANRAAAVYRWQVTEQVASHEIWGVTFASGSGAGTEAPYRRNFRSDYPYHIQAFTGNGAIDEIPLDHKPVSTAYAWAWQDQGVPLTVSSVNTTTKTATLSTTPAADRPVYVLYGYSVK
jgi:hypothetical protein